jgi:PST family polysaccharide transporter
MTLLEQLAIWLAAWADMFILGKYLSAYYLGLYKTSLQMVNSIMQVITASTIPVLFSTLSRIQDDKKQYESYLFNFQRMASFLVFPLGIGVLLYRELATSILLGSKWLEAAPIIGIWCLTKVISMTTSTYCSEIYRSKGRPDVSFAVQFIYLLFLIPACLYGVRRSFWCLIYAKAFVTVPFLIVNLIAIKVFMDISPAKMIKNLLKPILCTAIMSFVALGLQQVSDGILWSFVSIFICVIVYAAAFYVVSRSDARMVFDIVKQYILKFLKRK